MKREIQWEDREWECPKCHGKFKRVSSHPEILCSHCGHTWKNEFYKEQL